MGLGAGLEFVRRRGVERICQEELQKLRYLHGRLSRLGKVTLYTPPPEERFSAPVLSFNLEGVPSERVGEFLAQGGIAVRCGLHCAPLAHRTAGTLDTGTVRVSFSHWNTREEVYRLLAAIGEICR